MASELKVDKITGVTTAGSIDVTGEGNSTTTNLQQGLAKAWANYGVGSGTVLNLNQSFNVSSTSDEAAGDFDFNFSNVLSAIGSGYNMSARYSDGTEFATQTGARVFTTHISVKCGSNTTTQTDHDEGSAGVLGDLA